MVDAMTRVAFTLLAASGILLFMKASTSAGDPQKFVGWLEDHLSTDGLKISDAAIARSIETNQSTIHRWRQGDVGPSPDMLRRAAEALDLPILMLYVKAGYMTEEEADLQIHTEDIADYSFNALLEEIHRRYDECKAA